MLDKNQTPRRREKFRVPTIDTLRNTVNKMKKVSNLLLTRANGDAQVNKGKHATLKMGDGRDCTHPFTARLVRQEEIAFGWVELLTRTRRIVPKNCHKLCNRASLRVSKENNIIGKEKVG